MSPTKINDNYVSFKEHFQDILVEKDRAVDLALAAAKEAVGVAEKNAEKWRDNANEWRAAMNDKDSRFALKSEVESVKESMSKMETDIKQQLSEIKSLVSTLIGNKEGMKDKWGYLFGAFMLVFAIWSWFTSLAAK